MDLKLTPEQDLIIGMVRRFVRDEVLPLEQKLDPDADELDEPDRLRLVEKTKEMGLYGLDIPPEYGGPDIDLVTRTLMAVEMSQHRAGLYAPCYGTFGGAGLAQLFEATEAQKEKYLYPTLRGEKRGFFGLSEPSGGSDPARAIQTKAERDGDDWVINGGKLWISGADKADFGLVCSRAPTAIRAVTASPVLSWIPINPDSTSVASFTHCALRITPLNCNSKICGLLMKIFLANLIKVLRLPMIV